jgi:hypothetical protein
MLTYEQIMLLIVQLEILVTEIRALRAGLQIVAGALTQTSAAAIAAFAIKAAEQLDVIDSHVARGQSAPPAIPRERPLAAVLSSHTEMILKYLASSERYFSEMLETANELIEGARPIDRESRTSLEALSNCSRNLLWGVEIQLYRLTDCQGRIIFDSTFRLNGECGIDQCFCSK